MLNPAPRIHYLERILFAYQSGISIRHSCDISDGVERCIWKCYLFCPRNIEWTPGSSTPVCLVLEQDGNLWEVWGLKWLV